MRQTKLGGAQLATGGQQQNAALGEPRLPDDEYQHALSSCQQV